MSLWLPHPFHPEVDREDLPSSFGQDNHMFPRGYAGAPPKEGEVPSLTAGTEELAAVPFTTPGKLGGSRADSSLLGTTMDTLDDYRASRRIPDSDES